MSTSRWLRAVLTLAASAAVALGGVEPSQAAPPSATSAARLPAVAAPPSSRRRRRRRRDAADRAEPGCARAVRRHHRGGGDDLVLDPRWHRRPRLHLRGHGRRPVPGPDDRHERLGQPADLRTPRRDRGLRPDLRRPVHLRDHDLGHPHPAHRRQRVAGWRVHDHDRAVQRPVVVCGGAVRGRRGWPRRSARSARSTAGRRRVRWVSGGGCGWWRPRGRRRWCTRWCVRTGRRCAAARARSRRPACWTRRGRTG